MRLSSRATIGAIALGFTLVRLLAARWIHLTEDEAYYRLWAQHLQWGYYDHPPMVAWWIRAGVSLIGDNPLGVRLFPVLATGAATWLLADLMRWLGGDANAAARSALWYNATITVGLGSLLATPDAPAAFFWVVALWCLAQVRSAYDRAWWCSAGTAVGLAIISKYSALFLVPGVFLWIYSAPERRPWLRSPWPWAAAGIAGLIFATNVGWNAQHGWLTFEKQFSRVQPGGFAPAHLIELLVTQIMLLNPVIALYAVKGLDAARQNSGRVTEIDLALPVMASAPFIAYLLVHSLHDRVQGHWPVPLFSALVICACAGAAQAARAGPARWVRNAAIGLFLVLNAGALAYMAAPQSRAFGTFDPILPLRGWREFSQVVEKTRHDAGAGWVGTVSYGTLAQLSSERLVSPPLLQVTERQRYLGLPATPPNLNQQGLIVDLARRLTREDLLRCFSEVTPITDLDRGVRDTGPAVRYRTFLVAAPKVDIVGQGCPEDPNNKR